MLSQGVDPIFGDIREPKSWIERIGSVDAIIHAAATFTEDMGEVDRSLVDAIAAQSESLRRTIRFIYTGGVWLYGDTGDQVASETSPLNPIQSFAWMIENGNAVLDAQHLSGNIIHPGLVYSRDGGCFERFIPSNGQIEVWGSLETRWPLVHRDDLAAAYRLVLEHGDIGASYNVCAESGVSIGSIVRAMSKRYGPGITVSVRSAADVKEEFGAWADGPLLDQQVSGDKVRSLGWVPRHVSAERELA